jgi:hypothetical protein
MAGEKFLKHSSGLLAEQASRQSSSGAADAGKIVALDATGKLDNSLLPTGIGAETKSLPTTESLSDGDFVNIFDNSGAVSCRKADATTQGKEAHGFVLAAIASGASATVYVAGINTHLSALTGGPRMYLSTTAGAATSSAPSASGNVVQEVGQRLSDTEIAFAPKLPMTLA